MNANELIYRKALVWERSDGYLRSRSEIIDRARRATRQALGVDRLPAGPWTEIEAQCLDLPEKRAEARRLPPQLTIQQRLEARTLSEVKSAFRSANYREAAGRWAGGETTYRVRICGKAPLPLITIWTGPEVGFVPIDDPAWDLPFAEGASHTAWSSNGKWRGNNATLTASIPRTWLRDVHRPGLAVVDGMFTLAAQRLTADGADFEAWTAVWAEQSQGFALKTIQGVIVRRDGQTAHAATIQAGLRLLSRRAAVIAAEKAAKEKKEAELLAEFAGNEDLLVTFEDSTAAGNCPSGTRDWVAKHFPGRTTATIREVMNVSDRQSFALRACRAAVVRITKRG